MTLPTPTARLPDPTGMTHSRKLLKDGGDRLRNVGQWGTGVLRVRSHLLGGFDRQFGVQRRSEKQERVTFQPAALSITS
jgi:hypothetical protein